MQTTQAEIERLKRLQRAVELALQPLTERRHLSSDEATTLAELKKKRLRLEDRLIRLESIPPDPDVA